MDKLNTILKGFDELLKLRKMNFGCKAIVVWCVFAEFARRYRQMAPAETVFLINVVCGHYRGQLRRKGILPKKSTNQDK